MKNVKIQRVTWNDHYDGGSGDKLIAGAVEMEPWTHTTVGFLVAESDTMIALAQHKQHAHFDTPDRFMQATYIVKAAIVSRKTLA